MPLHDAEMPLRDAEMPLRDAEMPLRDAEAGLRVAEIAECGAEPRSSGPEMPTLRSKNLLLKGLCSKERMETRRLRLKLVPCLSSTLFRVFRKDVSESAFQARHDLM
jgi:hypothetical protein